jgi:FAD/FMN-containing dehydrogenase
VSPTTRRAFLQTLTLAGAATLLPGCQRKPRETFWVNDVHSRLTPTEVQRILRPHNREELIRVLRRSLHHNSGLSIAGGRHSMGGQPFGTKTIHFDLTGLQQIGDLDSERGVIEVAPGVIWPRLMEELDRRQANTPLPWTIIQKQTGADALTLGGAMAANMHGRGLSYAPFVQDIESFRLFTAEGEEISCSRTENPDWFQLVLGGYGLFGVVTSLQLRLRPRQSLQRNVTLTTLDQVPDLIERRIQEGCQYGDFQFSPAAETDGFLHDGVLSTYHPVAPGPTPPTSHHVLGTDRWKELIRLAHTQKAEAFRKYVAHYRTTDGQIYASDRQQMSTYLPDYHEVVAEALGHEITQSLVITELYVPRDRLIPFFNTVRNDLRENQVDLVYGVVRWIEADRETFLPWAKDRFACIIFNLNVIHTEEGQAKAARDFRRLIDRALEHNGSFYLTYHRHADRSQILQAYPRFPEFLAEKEKRDRHTVWRSDWFKHYRNLLSV